MPGQRESWITMRVTLREDSRMRGDDEQQASVWSYIPLEQRVPADHPLRPLRAMVDGVLVELSPQFERLYARVGRPSIAPEKLLRTLLLQALYSVRSERLLMEQLDYNLLFRWFVGLNADDPVWDATVFTKRSSGGSRWSACCARRATGASPVSAGCSPSAWRSTTWCGCGISRCSRRDRRTSTAPPAGPRAECDGHQPIRCSSTHLGENEDVFFTQFSRSLLGGLCCLSFAKTQAGDQVVDLSARVTRKTFLPR